MNFFSSNQKPLNFQSKQYPDVVPPLSSSSSSSLFVLPSRRQRSKNWTFCNRKAITFFSKMPRYSWKNFLSFFKFKTVIRLKSTAVLTAETTKQRKVQKVSFPRTQKTYNIFCTANSYINYLEFSVVTLEKRKNFARGCILIKNFNHWISLLLNDLKTTDSVTVLANCTSSML